MSRKLPKTDSIEALAQFWDDNDLTDFEKDLAEVEEPVFDNNIMINVLLKQDEVKLIKQIAKLKGISDTALIQKWIREKIELI